MSIKYVVVASPDKISLPSFAGFLKRSLGNDYGIVKMHNLMSKESTNLFIKDYLNKYSKGIISYYAKRAVNVDPIKVIPDSLERIAESIIWFELYSNEPKVIKDIHNNLGAILEDWNNYIKRLSD